MTLSEHNCSRKGSTVAVKASTPSRAKYPAKTRLTRFLGRILKVIKRPKRTALPTRGNFKASYQGGNPESEASLPDFILPTRSMCTQ